jgi:anaphase-promoting complex subunit 5
MQSRDRTFYQYALLNLAILQADFGCYSEAIPAMQEAIATARENKDTTCLNFCMSWLHHFGKAFPAEMKELRDSGILGSETESLAFLKSRTKDTEMWSLLSTTLLNEAKLGLQHGDSLAQIFETIAKAKHINMVKSVFGPAILMQALAYSRVGLTHLTWSCRETFLQCHSSDAPAEDILKCSCHMASMMVEKGRYKEASEIMGSIANDILRVLKYQKYWIFFSGMLKLRRYLHRNDIDAAMNVLQRLQSQGAPDIELRYSLVYLEIDLLIRRGMYDAAMELAESVAAKAQVENSDVLVQVKLLSIKARLLAICGHPLKGFTMIVRAANIASRSRLLPALWEATGVLSNILIELSEFAAAVALLEAILPQVIVCQDSNLEAWTFSYLADAHMGLAGQENPKSSRRKEQVSKAMEHIDCAFQQFRHIEDLKGQTEVLAKKALMLHWRGDLVLANDTASQYLGLKKEYAAAQI